MRLLNHGASRLLIMLNYKHCGWKRITMKPNHPEDELLDQVNNLKYDLTSLQLH